MVRPTLDQIRAVGDFATVFRWNMIFAKAPNVGSYPEAEALNLRCESIELPKANIEPITTSIRGHEVHQPGILKYPGTITLNFVETVDNTIADFLREWREACWESRTGVSNPKADVEATIILELLDNQDQPRWKYTLHGCFYQDTDPGGTPDGSTSDFLKPTVTLQFDFFEDEALT